MHERTHGKPFLDFADSFLSYPPYNIRSGRQIVNTHYSVLNVESMADAVALDK